MALSPNALFGYFDKDPKYSNTLSMLKILQRDFPEKFKGLLSQPERMQEWKDKIDTGEREDDQTRDDIAKYIIGEELLMSTYGLTAEEAQDVILGGNEGGTNFADLAKAGPKDVGGGVETVEGAPKEEKKDEEGVGGLGEDEETKLTILTGKEMKWYFDKTSGKWYVEYGLPNSDRTAIFEASPDQMDALFGENQRPNDYQNKTFKEITSKEGATFSGNISEMEGTGSFEGEVERVINIALDEGKLPEWAAKDGVAMDIIYTAQAEGKSLDWTLSALSKTDSFKQRFPGMEKFTGDNNMTLLEGITGYLEYEAGVTQALKSSGLDFEASPEMIGNLLNAGHSLTVINKTVEGFRRMQAYGPALDAFNQVLIADGKAPITSIQEMFDFVQGNSSAAVYELYEASSIAEAAAGAGLGKIFTAEDALTAAESGTFDLTTATSAMRKASEMLLRLRHEVDVNRFGLDQDELIDISLGQTPRSGRAESEIMESINRAVLSAKGGLQQRAKSFTSFGASGTPQASSLKTLRRES